ncbi:MAG: Methyltransferase type 11 [Candidatus Woesebacteria bacterium GW2011_GWA1_33_30]|uniref:Methyltransferase type 11 n=1 Tax=Candidatus Woesebacteria bacterium GW2011_GWA2_33_28 TaxID=1618561 RepID=A0A0G0AAH7_9BACT|nr:MAG: Methyltransferase type 11 [Candidatus Woesebacteria bacterium GW2011_GWA2_33_28]KKP49048.1 MAG: Methyltransferase type 11 [Candidatus Woesebacteria bacterium GW2011_GWA1_33_30]KKP49844.1 MAG: Methyltransferase type 11 [Microgenomates group bacterium GW2011_GWC1_33_32]KKP52640.1 MAG: Methyltransferase type 11 [Candidatus Woesebacteria bacterium GW2011_GWB1_33_38]KKP58817.1 MAG: Methyltransferase type 11 [Microgenomates group bacterium GW2011_GWD1_33_9]
MAKLTKHTCLICGSKKHKEYWAMHGYKLAKCSNCSFVWDFFHSENVLAQYDKSYFQNQNPKGGYANYYEGMRVNKKTFTDRLNKIQKRISGKGKFLDVGCALGDCLMAAKEEGWKDVSGVEVSKFAYEFAIKRGLNVKNTTLDKAGFKPNSFEAIAYQDVIEHVEDPLYELETAHKLLKNKGYIFLVTPDVGGLWHKLLNGLWYHYKPGEHIMYFSQASLRLALEKTGYKNIETRRTYHVLSIEYVLNRLKYYSPFIFDNLAKIVHGFHFKDFAFKAYTGEIEAWGQK